MKRRYSISLWLETECVPQEIREILDQQVRQISTTMGMVRLQPLARRTFMIMAPAGPGCAGFIARGSAIMADWHGTDLEIYYEGGCNQPGMTFEDKCLHAADRFVTRYPTIACAVLPANELMRIGTYSFNDDGTNRQVEITNAVAFMKWIGLPVPTEGD